MPTRTPDGDSPDPGRRGSRGLQAADTRGGDAALNGQDADLAAGLSALSQLTGQGRGGLAALLTEVAKIAVAAIPGAEGAGLTLLETDGPDLVVKSTEFVQRIDDIQYALGQGPCISAAQTGRTVRSGSLGGDRRWPRFGSRASQLGVHSVLSLPLRTPAGVIGAMNIYAHAENAFDDRAAALGELFAVPAAISVLNAQILAQSQRLAERLQAALTSRPVIDQAIGILRSRRGDTAAQAFDRLRAVSETEHRPLIEVATTIVDEAAARARNRRTGLNRPRSGPDG